MSVSIFLGSGISSMRVRGIHFTRMTASGTSSFTKMDEVDSPRLGVGEVMLTAESSEEGDEVESWGDGAATPCGC